MVGILIGSAGTAVAAENLVKAVFAKFNIQINQGETVEIQAIVESGTSYYPIRVIADLLDHDVNYDDVTRTILLESRYASEHKPSTSEESSEGVEQMENKETETAEHEDITLDGVIFIIEDLELRLWTLEAALKENLDEERKSRYTAQKNTVEEELIYYQNLKEELESE